MKKVLVLIFAISLTTLNAQNVNIPDARFKSILVANAAINTNNDAEIQISEAQAFSDTINLGLPFFGGPVTDLTGIQAFTQLKGLVCTLHQLTSLDLSSNTELIYLDCSINPLMSLDLSNNTKLRNLSCVSNQLTALDVSNNTQLNSLTCGNNQLTSLDVSNNTQLTILICAQNQITALDVSNQSSLVRLDCSSNQIATLDLSNNLQLGDLRCQINRLASLDVSNNTKLVYLHCTANLLTSLIMSSHPQLKNLSCQTNQITTDIDVSNSPQLEVLLCQSNQFSMLNVQNGNNPNITAFNATGNPNLSCILVDDVTYATTNWTAIDAHSSFNTSCLTNTNAVKEEIEQLRYYPNPTTDGITIDLGATYSDVKIEVSSILGKTILEQSFKNITSTTIPLGKVPGVYVVTVHTNHNQQSTLKVIKK